MVTEADNVRVGVTGAAAYAPVGTDLPVTTAEALDAAFEDIGYIGEKGITQGIKADVTDIKAWQNGDVVRKVQTSHDLTYQLIMLETNDRSLEAYYGDVEEITGHQLPHKAWVFDVADDTHDLRLVVPDGQISDRGDVTYSNGEAIGYEITITAYPDASGVKAYLYQEAEVS